MKSETADAKTAECRCLKCVSACHRFPGWFEPGQAETVAAYLGVTLEELFRSRLVVDYWAGGTDGHGQDIYVLAPANEGNRPGEVVPFAKQMGRCVFLTDEGRCAIHPVKPTECAIDHHSVSDEDYYRWRVANAAAWAEHQHEAVKLLEAEPEPTTDAERVLGGLEILARMVDEQVERDDRILELLDDVLRDD